MVINSFNALVVILPTTNTKTISPLMEWQILQPIMVSAVLHKLSQTKEIQTLFFAFGEMAKPLSQLAVNQDPNGREFHIFVL